jgi:Tfp pilus assembly protein PilZ
LKFHELERFFIFVLAWRWLHTIKWHKNCLILNGSVQMDEERRNETRLEKQLLVNISKDDGFESMGLTSNLSKEGMFIATPDVLPLNCEVSILLGIADETFTLKGRVIWSQEWSNGASSDVQAAAGIKILAAPEQYFKYVENMVSQSN